MKKNKNHLPLVELIDSVLVEYGLTKSSNRKNLQIYVGNLVNFNLVRITNEDILSGDEFEKIADQCFFDLDEPLFGNVVFVSEAFIGFKEKINGPVITDQIFGNISDYTITNFYQSKTFQHIKSLIENKRTKHHQHLADTLFDCIDNKKSLLNYFSQSMNWNSCEKIAKSELNNEVYYFENIIGMQSPFAIFFPKENLSSSTNSNKLTSILFNSIIDDCIYLNQSGKIPELCLIFYKDQGWVFCNGRSKNTKMYFNRVKLKEHGWVRNSISRFHQQNLPKTRFGTLDVGVFQ